MHPSKFKKSAAGSALVPLPAPAPVAVLPAGDFNLDAVVRDCRGCNGQPNNKPFTESEQYWTVTLKMESMPWQLAL